MAACEICGADNNIETHHIIPRRYDGSDCEDNLVDLCRQCHRAIEEIYTDDVWDDINLSMQWDASESPAAADKLWKERRLRGQLRLWQESIEDYGVDGVENDQLHVADAVETESKTDAFKLGRYQAFQDLLQYLDYHIADLSVIDSEPPSTME